MTWELMVWVDEECVGDLVVVDCADGWYCLAVDEG